MAGRNNSLLDADFEDDDDFTSERTFGDDTPAPKVNDVADKDEDASLVVEIVDDTPEADRDKWNADKLSTDKTDDDDEAAAYSRRVKERIAKETAKVHAERRAKEDRERQLNELSTFSKKMLEENNRLKALIESGEKVLVTESTGRIDGQIAAAKAALHQAIEAGDVSGQIAAQENLAKYTAEKDRIGTYRPQAIPRSDEKELERFTAPVQQQAPQPDQRALEWRENNKWFQRDEAMTAFAMGLHSQLVNREGIMPQGETYWNRLDTEMRKRFPEKFSNSRGEPRRTDNVVAPAVRSNNGKVTRKVTLTSSQVQLARRLGLTVEQYAEQLALESGR